MKKTLLIVFLVLFFLSSCAYLWARSKEFAGVVRVTSRGRTTTLSGTPAAAALAGLVQHAFETATTQLQLLTLPADIENIRSTRLSIEVIFTSPVDLMNRPSGHLLHIDHLLVYLDDYSQPPQLVVYFGAGAYSSGPYIDNTVTDQGLLQLIKWFTTFKS